MLKKLTAILLCVIIALMCSSAAFAQDVTEETDVIKLINYNVDGLPIPAFLTSEDRDPLECSLKIPAVLNAFNADIIAVQEDFSFHSIHKNNIDMPYKTLHSGTIPFGDGLNYFSKYPIYNVHREAWNDAYGVFDSSSDELTPKGFLCASMEIADGVFVDVYDMHADADDGEYDIAARLSEYRQLLDYVNTYSKDHAVIITGDTNSRFLQLECELKKMFIDEAGFKEAWIELENEGRYTLTDEDIAKFNGRYSSWWGVWDSAEKTFYRSGGGVSLEALSHEYRWLTDEEGTRLADHAAEIVELRYTIDRNELSDTRDYQEETFDLANYINLHIRNFFKSLFLILR
ncbi:MAG: hypothetical protein IJU45_07810, partial [Clostridia bacterium]|nr:hypothetical protein [Clostridia bacterium]